MKDNAFQENVKHSLERLQMEIGIAEAIQSLYPQAKVKSEIRIAKALMEKRLSSLNADNVANLVGECEALLPETAHLLKSFTVNMVAHAHIDMNWMWGYDETVAVTLDTFETILKLMERYPDFTFSQSQASVYRIVEKYDHDMLNEIKKRVAEGRWEVSSCTWVEGDKNMASGESQVRQILYAKRYFHDLFGLDYDDIKLDFEPDTFGHNLNVPAILSRAGVKYYYHCRALDGPKLYRWQSPDGSRLLCYHEKDDWYNYDVLPERIVRSVLNEVEKTGSRSILRVYGVGDHGGGPTIRDIETVKEMSSWPVFPTIMFSTYKEYFDVIERSGLDLPVLEGEHNFIFTGCYTSQSETKAANRYGEKLLSVAESFSALAGKLTEGFDYPKSDLSRAWERVLFNQFHDILPGSGKRQTRHYALGQHQEVKAATGIALKKALAAINKAVDMQAVLRAAGVQSRVLCDRALGAGAGFWQECKGMSAPAVDDSSYRIFTVFNPSSFWRSEVVEAVLWDMGDSEDDFIVKDCQGKEVVHQVTEGIQSYWSHTFRRILFEADSIPPLGYKTFVVCQQHSQPNIKAQPVQLETPAQAVLENDRLRIELDTVSGAIKSLLSKEIGEQFVPEDGLTALFRIIDEAAALPGKDGMPVQGMTAWQVGAYSDVETIKGIKFIKTAQPPDFYSTVERSSFRSLRGPLRNGYVWSARMRSSELTTAIYLDKGSNRINIDCKCDWLEVSRKGEHVPQLNIVFPLSLENSARHFEIPFGSTRRDIEDIDVPALRWGDISGVIKGTDRQAGLTVMTDSKYGYRTGDDYISVSLIRSSNDPDPYPELGEHCFSLAVIPHDGLCNVADAFRQAIAFDQPLIVSQAVPAKGIMPPECSFVEIKNNNLVLSSLKKQEDGEGTIIRLYEVAGTDTEAEIRLQSELFGEKVLVTEIDLLECRTGVPMVFSSDAVKGYIPAYGLLTLLVEVI